jgi:hypothetical protein
MTTSKDRLEKEHVINWTLKIGSFIMSIAIMISSWFLNQAWNRIGQVESKVQSIELVQAETRSNKFTSTDFNNAKVIIDAERLALDRRVIRLEESLPTIKDSLTDIKQTLKEIKSAQ